MISIDAVRAAVLSDEPWTRLDELVRAELASGRTTKQIFDDLRGMAKEVRGTPGLSEDGEDAFGDTLDALVGFCSSRYAYKNPPSLPTEEEIATLPRWARVAFAARCARRVLPLLLFDHDHWPGFAKFRSQIEAAVPVAEGSARDGMTREAAALMLAEINTATPGVPTRYVDAFWIASGILWSARITDTQLEFASGVVRNADRFAEMYFDLTQVIRRDFDHLARLVQWQHWTDDTPVPPEVFGPLWPEGPPPGWPADPDLPQRTELPLAFVAREGTLPRVIEDEVVNLFNALNRYYILRTGDRLTVDGDIHTLLAALNPAGVS
ncbi:MAG TPA: hypothetical protein VFG68_10295 [Fimbriiglobus sp.]|nr:hypothetical protein [Fimbriiglobus sp.]